MPDVEPLKAIEAALARVAVLREESTEKPDVEAAAKWLDLRERCLDQNAAKGRRLFWRTVLCLFLVAVVVVYVLWLMGIFTRHP